VTARGLLWVAALGGCAGPPAVELEPIGGSGAESAPLPPRLSDPAWLPRWRTIGGRARVALAQPVARWRARVPAGACLEARPLDDAVGMLTRPLLGAADQREILVWGHGRLLLGACGQAIPLTIDAPVAPVALTVAAGDQLLAVPAPGGALAVEAIALAGGHPVEAGAPADGALVIAGAGGPPGSAFLYINDVLNDHDGDGLGAELEAELGTSDSALDSDEDGIDDGMETLGYHVPPDPPQTLPAWGASPTHKDLFVEADWEDDGGPTLGFVDGPSVVAPTALRFARLRADSIANPDGQPGVALHVDNGVPDGGGVTWGDWGGFSVVPRTADGSPDSAERWGAQHAFFPSRRGVFHYVLAHSRATGGAWGFYPGDEVLTHRLSQSAFQEELGHNVLLGHHGAGLGINCKPNYPSHMNYAFNGDFSTGRFVGISLNPTHLDETRGLGVSDPTQLAYLTGPPFYYTVRADGAIDWNRDGQFDTDVRAWINYPVYFGFSCENARYRVDGWGGALGHVDPVRPALARDGDRVVVLFAQDGQLGWRSMRGFVNCGADLATGCGDWTPPHLSEQRVGGGIAATPLGGQLQVVAEGADGRLRHYALDGDVLSPLAELPAASADPALVADGDGLLLVYSDGDGHLAEQRLSPAGWAAPVATPELLITAGTGVALARGTLGRDGAEVLRAATVIDGRVAILRREAAGWRVEPDAFTTEPPETDRAPGLAFAPADPGVAFGRYYLVLRGVGISHVMRIDLTDADGRFAMPALQDNIWSTSTVGPTLLYDEVAGHIKLARTGGVGELLIWPYADGLYDVEMRDVDDAQIIRAGLCYALRGCGDPTCPPPPAELNPCGGTQPTVIHEWPDDLPIDPPL
jgi:hypothetical protein